MYQRFVGFGGEMVTLVSKGAAIGRFANEIEKGATILSRVVIESDNKIAMGTILHVGCFVSHDVRVGRFCEISPFAKLLGGVTVGDFCSIGSGCIILPRISIGDGAVIGAGSVVTKDVAPGDTVFGVPASRKG
jgi:acetyltransferase-like isoleucine patch superfamily enzyme